MRLLLRDFPNLPRTVNILLFDSWNNTLHDCIVSSKHLEVLCTVSSSQRSSEIAFLKDLMTPHLPFLRTTSTNKLGSVDNVYTDTPNYNVVHVVPIEAFTMKSISTYSSDVCCWPLSAHVTDGLQGQGVSTARAAKPHVLNEQQVVFLDRRF